MEKDENVMEKFLTCYEAVFNEDGSRKLCGREKCKELIMLAEQLAPEAKSGEFGSKERGILYEPALKAAKELIDVCAQKAKYKITFQ